MLSFLKKKKTIVTHNGKFHADDIFACATLMELLGGSASITRTRDKKLIDAADYVVDVGGVHNPELNRFDHHQEGGAGKRENGMPYAAFGLVWKQYGEKLCSAEVAGKIEKMLTVPIDANDNGIAIDQPAVSGLHSYTIQDALYSFRPTWLEDESQLDAIFLKNVAFARQILEREIKIATDTIKAKDIVVSAYENAVDKRVIIFDTNCPANDILVDYPDPLFIVRPRPDGTWGLNTISKEVHSFERRKDLPALWAGKSNEEMAQISGVSDAIFCHNGRFLAVARSREGALQLAKIALEA